jgi:transcriptional regulator with XRE-family HTH domain
VSEHQQADVYGFGQFLLSAMARAGYKSPTALARVANLSPSVILRWTRNEVVPSVRVLQQVAPLLGVPEADLIAAAHPAVDAPPVDPLAMKDAFTLGRQLDAWLHPDSDLSPRGRDHLRRLVEAAIFFAEQDALAGARDTRFMELPPQHADAPVRRTADAPT